MKPKFYFLLPLSLFFLMGCATKSNYVSYSFRSFDYNSEIERRVLPHNQFINYDNHIFEFVLKTSIVTDIYLDGNNSSKSTISLDTTNVFVYNLKSKTYSKIWPFNSNFKVVEKNQQASLKKEGFMIQFEKTKKSEETQMRFTTKIIDSLRLFCDISEDSISTIEVYAMNHKYFKSPYELFTDVVYNKYTMVGYNIKVKNSSENFGSIIADVKPINSDIKKLCAQIISKLEE